MATARKLLSIVGKPIKCATFQTLISQDRLKASKEPDLKENLFETWYFVAKKHGYEILAEAGRVVAVFLYAEPADGYDAFSAPLPHGVPRGSTRTEVRHQLGKPERNGQAYDDKILGPQSAWDRFAVGSIRIHFEYSYPELQVQRITLMTEDGAP